MATKRRRKHAQQPHGITAEAIRAYRDGDRGGLNRALGIRPWEVSPLDAVSEALPAWCSSSSPWGASWPKAYELRKQLEAAAK